VIKQLLSRNSPDVVCLTESHSSFLDGGHQIEAEAYCGYQLIGDRRKVLLWSRHPWSNVDAIGDPSMPGGRFVRGQTRTPIGELTVIGICIPWNAAHVSSGRRDSSRWQEHARFLEGMHGILTRVGRRAVALGDFNQTIPRSRQPLAAFEALDAAFAANFRIATTNVRDQSDRSAIDHVFSALDLKCDVQDILPARHEGRRLSDHFGSVAALRTVP
jgi:endonuclease/exonuclease/phosphatase family metal-dependent hydrolase